MAQQIDTINGNAFGEFREAILLLVISACNILKFAKAKLRHYRITTIPDHAVSVIFLWSPF